VPTNSNPLSMVSSPDHQMQKKNVIGFGLGILFAILGFFFAIQLIGVSFQAIGKDFTGNLSMAFANPAIGLLIGLLGTTILQSSSTTTSMVVAAVAAGSLSLQNAIPIIMGANVGTTLTSTIISMSYITKTGEFRKAVSAGTVHDIFNVLTCVILFPLEIKYGMLSSLSHYFSSFISLSEHGVSSENWFAFRFLDQVALKLLDWFGVYAVLIISVALLFATVKIISNILYKRLIGTAKAKFENIAFQNTFKSFGWGLLLTSVIQSSSLTTSLIVPLVATGKIKLIRAFQFVVGANIGTTITALLAAIFKSEAALSLAMAHFLFNLGGMILFFAIPLLNKVPTYLAHILGSVSLRYKITGFAYIVVLFFLLPFTLIYFSNQTSPKTTPPISENYVSEKQIMDK